jgi:CHAD domain-containing protein
MYAFEPSEPIASAVARISGEQLDRVESHLAEGNVHDARKRMKEMRALLRLVRGPLGDAFDVENAWYRDEAKRLATARDIEAVVEALEELRKQSTDPEVRKRITIERRRLARRRERGLQSRIDGLVAELAAARARVATWPAFEERFATIGDGAERTLRDGRRALARALERRSDEAFHALRMRVKDHWHHVQLLRNVWPEVMKGYSSALDQLSHALGDLHDLTLAAPLVHDESVRTLIVARTAELEHEAIELASRVFSEKPGAWRKRLRGYWRAM